jgi:murein L,D-transpeptidase YafK
MIPNSQAQEGFKQSQLSYPRVREAYREKGDSLLALLSVFHLDPGEIELYHRVFKQEKICEIWARKKGENRFKKLKTYTICRTSGVPGPKRMQGDLQIPEGFYHLVAFNPWSNFHLSMSIDYPNRSDQILGMQGNLGGDICIHGSCVTIGCIPLTDEVIKEVYLLCIEARNNGQVNIPITIYPARMKGESYNKLIQEYDDRDRLSLWSDLKTAYEFFERNCRMPEVTFLRDGRHRIEYCE